MVTGRSAGSRENLSQLSDGDDCWQNVATGRLCGGTGAAMTSCRRARPLSTATMRAAPAAAGADAAWSPAVRPARTWLLRPGPPQAGQPSGTYRSAGRRAPVRPLDGAVLRLPAVSVPLIAPLPQDGQRSLSRSGHLEMIEVCGRKVRPEFEVVTTPRRPGSDALQDGGAIGGQVHRCRDAAGPGLLIEGQADHSLVLILARDRGLSRSGWAAHEDDPSHDRHCRRVDQSQMKPAAHLARLSRPGQNRTRSLRRVQVAITVNGWHKSR
jgi:hypothetical protein